MTSNNAILEEKGADEYIVYARERRNRHNGHGFR